MWIFSVLFIQIVLVHCLQGRVSIRSDNLSDSNQVNCGHNYQSNCLIEATFSNSLSNETIDVLVNCTNDNDAVMSKKMQNQFSKIEKIIWNGCYAVNNVKFFGLRKISNRKDVKMLKIEKFTVDTIEIGTFDEFTQLRILSFEFNFIEYLLSSCFRGLENLFMLQMIENNLKRISPETLGVLTKLNTLQIVDRTLFIANHQFTSNQIVENVAIDIYYIEMDLMEHLFNHVRNLSILLSFNDDDHDNELVECDVRMIGYETKWMIENLRLDNIRCQFIAEHVETLKSLELRKIEKFGIELKNLINLKNLTISFCDLKELTTNLLAGDFNELEYLDLSHNKLSTINMSIFHSFTKLKQINFNSNHIHTIDELDHPNILNIHIHVDYNSLDCEWLTSISSHDIFDNFIYVRNFKFINVNGLQCSLHQQQSMSRVALSLLSTHSSVASITEFHDENFNVKPKIFAFIICCTFLLGIAITFILIYTYNRIQLLNHQPFYHMLRDSLIRPFSSARDTLASDFKGIIFRNLPPTNYEHPISTEKFDDTELSELNENIYEEIPHKHA
ncbi:hypothetical protein ACKWTF_003851 [Chironomus riparius]